MDYSNKFQNSIPINNHELTNPNSVFNDEEELNYEIETTQNAPIPSSKPIKIFNDS